MSPSDSIKVVPGRIKLRVESSNPVARGNPIKPRTSKVKLISPEEAMKLSSGVTQTPVSPVSESIRHKPSPATPETPKPVTVRSTPEAPRAVSGRLTPEAPRPVTACSTPEAPRPNQARQASEAPRPVSACPTPEAPRSVSAPPTSEASRPFKANHAEGCRKEIVCGLRALSLTTPTVVRRRTSQSLLQSTTVEPPSPRALRIRAMVRYQQATANATQLVEGTVLVAGAEAKDHGSKEASQSISNEELSELLQCLPALHPTWKGHIVDSATPPEFDCEFWVKPASNIRKKALRLSKAMPSLLKAELLPLKNVFGRSPRLSDVQMYFFPDEKKTERFNGEHARLFEAMVTRDVMFRANINGTQLLIFSSRLLDKTSQLLINKQKKTENFLWGFIFQPEKSQALVPGTCLDDVVDMDLDIKYTIPTSLALKLTAENRSTALGSLGKVKREVSLQPPGFENFSTSPAIVKREEVSLLPLGYENPLPKKTKIEVSVPPGFEKKWTPPLVKLNIQGTSNPLSDQTGSAGIVRDQSSGKWLFGYSSYHKSMSEVSARILAIYRGLRLLWDCGFRKIRLETTSLEIIDVLTTKTYVFPKRRSILDCCKDMILKNWECEIHHISREQNSCAEWLASRLEEQPQGLVFFEYPPRALMNLL